jgi:hypothetical protein
LFVPSENLVTIARVAAHSAVHDGEPLFAAAEPVMTDNHRSVIEDITYALTMAEKQACYRERHLGVDGEKVASGSRSTLAPGRKWVDLHTTEVIQ